MRQIYNSLVKGYFFKEYNTNHDDFKEKRPHQKCLVNAFVRLVVIMNIASIKCISSLLSKHNN